MKERPILFSAPMVQALLDSRKTQTRRVVKPQPDWEFPEPMCSETAEGWQGPIDLSTWAESADPEMEARRCPYGRPGDRLWVRETCRGEELPDGQDGVRYLADGGFRPIENSAEASIDWLKLHTYRGHHGKLAGPKVPGIHMPRWASRILLEITDVRVERLNAISEADSIIEGLYRSLPDNEDRQWFHDWTIEQTGAPPTPTELDEFNEGVWRAPGVRQGWGMTKADRNQDQWAPTPQFAYRLLWESINGPGSWDANPWIWVLAFKRVEA